MDTSWQTQMIDSVAADLEGNPSVKALLLIGSCAQAGGPRDVWSDVDFMLVIEDKSVARFTSCLEWLDSYGTVYAHAVSEANSFPALRVFFEDGRRLDFLFVPETAAPSLATWRENPAAFGCQVLFSRISDLRSALSRETQKEGVPADIGVERIRQIANDFLFKGMLAAQKAARNDLLVALHLCLDMVRDSALLALMLRDATSGTRHHVAGDPADPLLAEFPTLNRPVTRESVLRCIHESAVLFDRLASRLNTGYVEHRFPLLHFMDRVLSTKSGGATTDGTRASEHA
jgi:hypothetical protein